MLTTSFLNELFRTALVNRDIADLLCKHTKYEHLPTTQYKLIFRAITRFISTKNTLPSIGQLQQMVSTDQDASNLVLVIEEAKPAINIDGLLHTYRKFIVESEFLALYDKVGSLWVENEREKIQAVIDQYAEFTNNLTFSGSKPVRLFAEWETRHQARLNRPRQSEKIPTGIFNIDAHWHGGIDRKETLCLIAPSGTGKTKFLRFLGVNAARFGYNVLHVQAEGSKRQCEDGYDGTWMGVNVHALADEYFTKVDTIEEYLKRSRFVLAQGGEIFIETYVQFGQATMYQVHQKMDELRKMGIKIDLLLIDYLEKMSPHRTFTDERSRREGVAEEFKNICVEFDCAGATATQAMGGLSALQLNNPNFVIRRDHISDFKNLINSFSFVLSFNRTLEEKSRDEARLWIEKAREYPAEYVEKIIQSYATEQFVDLIRMGQLQNTPTT